MLLLTTLSTMHPLVNLETEKTGCGAFLKTFPRRGAGQIYQNARIWCPFLIPSRTLRLFDNTKRDATKPSIHLGDPWDRMN